MLARHGMIQVHHAASSAHASHSHARKARPQHSCSPRTPSRLHDGAARQPLTQQLCAPDRCLAHPCRPPFPPGRYGRRLTTHWRAPTRCGATPLGQNAPRLRCGRRGRCWGQRRHQRPPPPNTRPLHKSPGVCRQAYGGAFLEGNFAPVAEELHSEKLEVGGWARTRVPAAALCVCVCARVCVCASAAAPAHHPLPRKHRPPAAGARRRICPLARRRCWRGRCLLSWTAPSCASAPTPRCRRSAGTTGAGAWRMCWHACPAMCVCVCVFVHVCVLASVHCTHTHPLIHAHTPGKKRANAQV